MLSLPDQLIGRCSSPELTFNETVDAYDGATLTLSYGVPSILSLSPETSSPGRPTFATARDDGTDGNLTRSIRVAQARGSSQEVYL